MIGKVELFFTATPLTDKMLREKTAIVVDVLRTSTSIPTALKNGCREVVPVASLGDASEMRSNLDRDLVLMCGERDGIKVEGFDLGNSPTEYSEDIVRDKILVFCSTNGSGAIIRCAPARQVITSGFVNLSAAVKFATVNNGDIAIVCAGTKGGFSLEDSLCGGMIVFRLVEQYGYEQGNDAARVALLLYNNRGGSIETAVREADHARYLATLGAGGDIAICAAVDTCAIVPVLKDGKMITSDQLTTEENEQ